MKGIRDAPGTRRPCGPHTLPLAARACQWPTRSNRITTPHAVPIYKLSYNFF
jgi:hypothetical protein